MKTENEETINPESVIEITDEEETITPEPVIEATVEEVTEPESVVETIVEKITNPEPVAETTTPAPTTPEVVDIVEIPEEPEEESVEQSKSPNLQNNEKQKVKLRKNIAELELPPENQFSDLSKTEIEGIAPKGYKLIRDFNTFPETKKEKKDRLMKQKEEIQIGTEPSDEELIEFAKMTHPYYMEKIMLDNINNELREL